MENPNETKKCLCKCHNSQYIVYQIDYCCCSCTCPFFCQSMHPITSQKNYETCYDYSKNNKYSLSTKNFKNYEENEKKSGKNILSENNFAKDKIKKIEINKVIKTKRTSTNSYLIKKKNEFKRNCLNINNFGNTMKKIDTKGLGNKSVENKDFHPFFSLNKLIPNKINTLPSSEKKTQEKISVKKTEKVNNQKNDINDNKIFTGFKDNPNYNSKKEELYHKIKKKYGLNEEDNSQIINFNKTNYNIKKDVIGKNINNNNNENDYKLEIIKLKSELSKANNIINDLKLKNDALQKMNLNNQSKIQILESKLKNVNANKEITNKVNKGVNTTENLNQIEDKENIKILNFKISEISEKYLKLQEISKILSKKSDEKDVIISNKNKEIDELKFRLNDLEKSGAIILNKLDYKSNDIIKQKDLIIENYKNQNFDLQNEIIQLKIILTQLEKQVSQLQLELKMQQKFDDKKFKLLEILYEFYLKIKDIVNFDEKKKKTDITLQEVIDDIKIEDFEEKLLVVKKKLNRFITDFDYNKKYGFGKCFACDIGCCTSHVNKMKNFRKSQSKK